VFNEKPLADERVSAASLVPTASTSLARSAVIHTTVGDIHVQMFPDACPKTCENFTTHSRNGYYDNIIFHRIIKGFMLQTGDPLGDGTGGVSIWGGEFEDEITRDLRHDRPYTVSMANAGPNTNGSQFFITTVATPWLDGKHTVFGRVTKGSDVVHAIENSKTDKQDRPHVDIKMVSITLAYK
jgi:peptidylprolyl isomerase domain and WD repeat-containing protein 1